MWLATGGASDDKGRYHFRPAVVRLKPDWWQQAASHSTLTLGLAPASQIALPYGVTNDAKPISADLIVKPAYRRVHALGGSYVVYDIGK